MRGIHRVGHHSDDMRSIPAYTGPLVRGVYVNLNGRSIPVLHGGSPILRPKPPAPLGLSPPMRGIHAEMCVPAVVHRPTPRTPRGIPQHPTHPNAPTRLPPALRGASPITMSPATPPTATSPRSPAPPPPVSPPAYSQHPRSPSPRCQTPSRDPPMCEQTAAPDSR